MSGLGTVRPQTQLRSLSGATVPPLTESLSMSIFGSTTRALPSRQRTGHVCHLVRGDEDGRPPRSSFRWTGSADDLGVGSGGVGLGVVLPIGVLEVDLEVHARCTRCVDLHAVARSSSVVDLVQC